MHRPPKAVLDFFDSFDEDHSISVRNWGNVLDIGVMVSSIYNNFVAQTCTSLPGCADLQNARKCVVIVWKIGADSEYYRRHWQWSR